MDARGAKSKVKQAILAVAIAIVLTIFIAYGISVFYEAPKYEKFCGAEPKPFYANQTSCEAGEGKWSPRDYPCPEGADGKIGKCEEGYCDANFKCGNEFSSKN